jgi:alkylation response protein AidB-like acyl-CoA dehydrogenase
MFQLSEQSLQIRDLARSFARDAVIPGAAERDLSKEYPAELVSQLGEMGFMGMFIPEEYGGTGLSILDYVVALEEISYADASLGVVMSVNNSLASSPIISFGTEAQKQKYLPKMATAEWLGCYALTEPSAGSDAAAQKTKVTVAENGDYIINGTKMWITNGPQADVAVVYASMDPEARHKAVCAFIVETSSEGFNVGKVEPKLGLSSSSTAELIFQDLRVPKENLLGVEREGFKVAMGTLDGGRIGIAAQSLGIAQRAFDLALAYSKERIAFGRPISSKQAIQWMLADMATRIEAARLLTWKAATLKDQGERASQACSMAKLFASECANFCADKAVQIHGGYGYSKEYEVERLYRDARITTLYEGTSEIQRLVIAKSLISG